MRIYISGKITGLDVDEAKNNFAHVATLLELEGHEAVNPMTLPHNHDQTWRSYMQECITHLMGCDAVFALSNCFDSEGAMVEITLARGLKMPIYTRRVDIEMVFNESEF